VTTGATPTGELQNGGAPAKSNWWSKTSHRALAIFLLSLVLNLVFVVFFVNTNKFPQLNSKQMGDSGYLIAVNLLEGNGYTQLFDGIEYKLWRPPTFPLFLAGLFGLVGKSYFAMRVSLCIFGALAAVATFFAARRLWSERVGMIAGFAVALNPSNVFSSGLTGPESLVALLLVLSFICLLQLRDTQSSGSAILAGVVIGLVALTKTFYLVYACAAVVWILIQKADKKRLRRSAVIFVAGFGLVLAPWMARNWVVVGKPRITSTDAALVLWGANVESWLAAPYTENRWPPKEFFDNFETLKGMDELTRDRWFVQQAIQSVRSHPAEYARRVVNRVWVMWKPFPHEASYRSATSVLRVVAMATTFLPLLVFFLAGAWRLRRDTRTFGIIYLLLLFVTGATALAHSTGRYRTPLEPLMTIIAAFAADRAIAWLRARRATGGTGLGSGAPAAVP